MKKEAKVSIIIPCYNSVPFLDNLFESIKKQKYSNLEIIMVDDGSTDRTKEIISEYSKKLNIKYYYQKNAGPAAAFNTALPNVTGEYLTWIDSDDFYECEAISSMVNFLENNKECDYVRGNINVRLENDLSKVVETRKPKHKNQKNWFMNYLISKDIHYYSGITMVRTDFFDKCNPKRILDTTKGGQNLQMLLPVTYYGNAGYIDQSVISQTYRANSYSRKIEYDDCKNEQLRYCTIKVNTIKSMNLPKEEEQRYIDIVNDNYKSELLNLSYRFHKKEDTKKIYRELKKRKKIKISNVYTKIRYMKIVDIFANVLKRVIK